MANKHSKHTYYLRDLLSPTISYHNIHFHFRSPTTTKQLRYHHYSKQTPAQASACLTTAAKTFRTVSDVAGDGSRTLLIHSSQRSPTKPLQTPASPPSTKRPTPSAVSATRSAVTPFQIVGLFGVSQLVQCTDFLSGQKSTGQALGDKTSRTKDNAKGESVVDKAKDAVGLGK